MISIFRSMFVICKGWPAVLAAGLVEEPFTPGLKPGVTFIICGLFYKRVNPPV